MRTERALCKLGLKDEKGALDDLQAAVAKEPTYAPAHYYLGGRLAEREALQGGGREYAKYLELAPNGSLAKAATERLKIAQDAAKGKKKLEPHMASGASQPAGSRTPGLTRPRPVVDLARPRRARRAASSHAHGPGDGASRSSGVHRAARGARRSAPASVRRATGRARAAARASGSTRRARARRRACRAASASSSVKQPERVRRRAVRWPTVPSAPARSRASERT